MGFFSSRKAEPTHLPASEWTSVKVIRSRFYGKSKSAGKASPVPSSPSTTLPTLPARIPEVHPSNQSPPSPGRPASANALTMSLAQRLNDLATANADGLLDDEEYRLLRQNLFERFADSDPPTEQPVVPLSNGTPNRYPQLSRAPSINSQRSISTTVSSLFRRATGRAAPSPTASTSGSVFSLQRQTSPTPDSASVMSNYSRPSISPRPPRSASFPNSLSRRPSDDSLMSSSQAGSTSGSLTSDLRGVISRRNIMGGASLNYASSISSRTTARSAKPPSAFHLRHPTLYRQTFSRTHEDDEDEDNPKSTADLREEIECVETEGRKLLDAFNGLELSALTKTRSGPSGGPLSAAADSNQRRLRIYPESASSALGSEYTLVPERSGLLRVRPSVPLVKQPVNLKRKPSVVNSIAITLKSSKSDLRGAARTSLQSTRSSPNLHTSTTISALPMSNSVPSAPLNQRPSILRQGPTSPSSPNGTAPPHTVPVTRQSSLTHRTNTDPALQALEKELADIRRRKADVSARYERRLEFLRAKLKAAEIRERLSKK